MTNKKNNEGVMPRKIEANTNQYGVDYFFSPAQLCCYDRRRFDYLLKEIETASGVVDGEFEDYGDFKFCGVTVDCAFSVGMLKLSVDIKVGKDNLTDIDATIGKLFWHFDADYMHYEEDKSLLDSLEGLVRKNFDLTDICEQVQSILNNEVTNADLLRVANHQRELRVERYKAINAVWRRGIYKHKKEVEDKATGCYISWLDTLKWDQDLPECDEVRMPDPKHIAFVDSLFSYCDCISVNRIFGYLVSRLEHGTKIHKKLSCPAICDQSLPAIYKKQTACDAFI